jgi:hypothetical protein
MVDIFNFYTTRRTSLTSAELDKLARLNASAKGIPYQTYTDVVHEIQGLVAAGKVEESAITPNVVFGLYRSRMFLPPGIPDNNGKPDMFSVWAGSEPELICTQYFVTHDCSDMTAIFEGVAEQFSDAWDSVGREVVHEVASVASNYPGIGTAISVAITALEQLGQGASLSDAALAAGRSAIPSVYRAAYDIGVGIVIDGKVPYDDLADVAMAAAISSGAVSGDVLERYNTIMTAYNDAKSTFEGVQELGTAVHVATG